MSKSEILIKIKSLGICIGEDFFTCCKLNSDGSYQKPVYKNMLDLLEYIKDCQFIEKISEEDKFLFYPILYRYLMKKESTLKLSDEMDKLFLSKNMEEKSDEEKLIIKNQKDTLKQIIKNIKSQINFEKYKEL